jgi:mono/diheme cytochrome c family protein
MSRILPITAALLGSTFLLSGDAAAQVQGRTLFEGKGNCWTCHGKDAKGTPLGPDLTDGEWINIDGSIDSIRVVVQRGVPKPVRYPAPMPPLGGARLSRAEIEALAAYVFSLQPAKQPQPAPFRALEGKPRPRPQ